jgi:hypothetical protein
MAGWDTRVENAITGASQKWGVDPKLLKAFARIESGGRPNARTGSYKGLFQLSDSEFGKYGGGNIYDPDANASAAAQKLAREAQGFKAKYGRDPAPSDLYMIHQQGEGGYAAHTANPNAPAWQNMYSTAEGRKKGSGWAKQAIWGNVPSDVRAQYPGGVDSLTSQQFLDLWAQKVARMSGDAQPSTHMAANAVREVANGAPKPMASPIGGAPVAGGPVPLTPPNQRYSKLADALMAQAAGADVKGWGDALRAFGGAALGYSLADKADEKQQAYQGKLAQALMGASGDTNNLATTLIGSGNPELVQQGVALKVSQAKESAPLRGREAFLPLPNGDVLDLNRMAPVPGITPKQEMTSDMREYAFSMKQRKDAGQPLVSFDDWAKTLKPNLAANKPVEVGGRLVQMNPATNQYEEVYVPPQKPAQLQAGDRKEIFEADEGAQASRNVIGSLDKALGMNDKAYSGFGAQTRGYLGSLVGSESGAATEELQNVVTQQVLENLKATFGSAPTEGERQILLDVQGSVSKSPEVRRRIFENAKAAAQRRLGFNTERAGALRSGDYFKPGYSPSAPEVAAPAPAAQPEAAAAPKQIRSQEEFSALPSGARFIDPEGKVRIKP